MLPAFSWAERWCGCDKEAKILQRQVPFIDGFGSRCRQDSPKITCMRVVAFVRACGASGSPLPGLESRFYLEHEQ